MVKRHKFVRRPAAKRGATSGLPPLRNGAGLPTQSGMRGPVGATPKQTATPNPMATPKQTTPVAKLPQKSGPRLRGKIQIAPTDSDLLEDAQAAYVRGERQRAIDVALGVAEREGALAPQAWRFIGLVACSVRSQRLATRAYQNVHVPADQRVITDACQHNGLSYREDRFTGE